VRLRLQVSRKERMSLESALGVQLVVTGTDSTRVLLDYITS
jgi:hypothetical protein